MDARNSSDRELDAEPDSGAAIDGRRLRREHGRVAVLDATIDLILAGLSPPTVEQIAAEAGVSVASVYRYFSTVGALRQAGIHRYFERYSHLMAIPDIGECELEQRIDNLVDARLTLHQTVEPIARIARQHATFSIEMSETLERVRATLTDQLSQHFANELGQLRPAARTERVGVIAVLTSFEGWDQMSETGLSRDAIRRAWCTHLRVLLDPSTLDA